MNTLPQYYDPEKEITSIRENVRKRAVLGKVWVPSLDKIKDLPKPKMEVTKTLCLYHITELQKMLDQSEVKIDPADLDILLSAQRKDRQIEEYRRNYNYYSDILPHHSASSTESAPS